jgi:hypothetical protein
MPVGLDTSRKEKLLVPAGRKRILAAEIEEEISTVGIWEFICLTPS